MCDSEARGLLFGYQQEGVLRLSHSVALLLADDMGLGKTVQAIVAMEGLFRAGAIYRSLIICPASLMQNWLREMRRWAPGRVALLYRGPERYGLLESNVPALISSFETITEDWRYISKNGEKFFDTTIGLVIVD